MQSQNNITFLGFGEAAIAFTKGWSANNIIIKINAFDRKTNNSDTREAKLVDYKKHNVNGHLQIEHALKDGNAIFCLVTADQAAEAAKQCAKYIQPNQLYFDCNSCAPQTKQMNAKLINAAGGKYVDVAIMAPVYPKIHKAPLLICGQYATLAQTLLESLDMNVSVLNADIGQASSIKMIRSIMIKGLEALNAECLLSARKLNIDDTILDSLAQDFTNFDWYMRSGYMLERMVQHGKRRASEMREVALTVDQLGLNNSMSKATVNWQQTIGDLELNSKNTNFKDIADQILKNINNGDEI